MGGTAHVASTDEVAEVAWCDRITLSAYVPYPIYGPVQGYLDGNLRLIVSSRRRLWSLCCGVEGLRHDLGDPLRPAEQDEVIGVQQPHIPQMLGDPGELVG